MEDYIYKNQTELLIEVDTQTDLTSLKTAIVKYVKPDKTTGSWSFTKSTTKAGVIERNVVAGDLNQSGVWVCWCYLTYLNLKVAPGTPFEMRIYEEGTI